MDTSATKFFFQICNKAQTKRNSVIVTSLVSLLAKGSEKFGGHMVSAVISETGCLIDDDDVLPFLPSTSVLMLLQEHEEWEPGKECSLPLAVQLSEIKEIPKETEKPSKVAELPAFLNENEVSNISLSNFQTSNGDIFIKNSDGTYVIGEPVITDVTNKSLNVLPVKREETVPNKNKDYSYYYVKDQIKKLPLPEFEDKLCHILKVSAAGTVKSSTHASVVQQTIEYYLQHIPNLKGYGGIYSLISQKMIKEYPSLGTGGALDENWIGFKDALSRRVRHVRFVERKVEKYETSASKKCKFNEHNDMFSVDSCAGSSSNNTKKVEPITTQKKFELLLSDFNGNEKISEEEYNQIMNILNDNYEKYSVSVNVKRKSIVLNSIKVAVREIYSNTKDWMKEVGSLLQIITRHPIYQNGEMWLLLLSLKLNDEDLLNAKASMTGMLLAMKTVMSSDEIPSLLDALDFFFEKTKTLKGNGPKSLPVIEVHKDIPYDSFNKYLKTKEISPMKIICFQKGSDGKDEFQSIWIVGHGQAITVPDSSILTAMLILFSTYYMLNVEYPKMYCGQLGMIQTYGFQISVYSKYKSIGYQKLCPSIERAFQNQT